MGRRGLSREGGLINILPLKREVGGGGFFERGGLKEDLQYIRCCKQQK